MKIRRVNLAACVLCALSALIYRDDRGYALFCTAGAALNAFAVFKE